MAIVTGTSGADVMSTSSVSTGVVVSGGGTALTNAGDTISAGGGSDTITAGTGSDTILGQGGNDVISPGAGNDTADGGLGSDVITYSTATAAVSVTLDSSGNGSAFGTGIGTDVLFGFEEVRGGSANDSLTAAQVIGANVFLRGNGGSDTLTRSSGNTFTVYADYANNTSAQGISANLSSGLVLDGLGGTDTLIGIFAIRGGAGNDVVLGTAAWETFRPQGGDNTFSGGGGSDRVEYFGAQAGIVANLATGAVSNNGYGGQDLLYDIDRIVGSVQADTITGHAGTNEFSGLGGADVFDGNGGGRDRLRYDIWFGTAPNTQVLVDLALGEAIDGYGTQDTFQDIDRVTGYSFDDTISGNAFENRFNGRAGNDRLDGRLGYDWVEYFDATSGVVVNLSAGTASNDGEGGQDMLTSFEGVIGSNHNDDLTGGAPTIGTHLSWLRGGRGDDILRAGPGWSGASYADQTQGMVISLAAGGMSDSTLGNDVFLDGIRGLQMYGAFNDTLTGGAGDDMLAPSGGSDVVDGGAGRDWISFGGRVAAGAVVNLALGTAQDGEGGTDSLTAIENVAGTGFNDTLTGDSGDNTFAPGLGNDTIVGGGGRDMVEYGAFTTLGSVIANTQTDDAIFNQVISNGVNVDLEANTAYDLLGALDLVYGIMDAGGSASLSDILRGSSYDNRLYGRSGNDILEGRAGDDTLDGGADTDQVAGGAGFDTSILAGARSGYSLARQDDGTLITFGTDGYDTHTGIEALRFGDGTIGLNSRAKDFWGDLRAGVLWQNGGTVWGWELNGTTVASQGGIGIVGSGWALAGTGDLDGNGRADAVFRNAAGDLYAWRMNGLGVASGAGIGSLPSEWQLAGMGDLDGNGTADMLWRRGSDGALYSWLMQDTAVTGGAWIGALPDWTVAALSDFTGDGRSDILLRKTDGTLFIAQMAGASPSAWLGVGAMGAEWAVRGAGDTNADGRSDIIWQNTATGAVWRWLMDGAAIIGADQLGTVGAPWAVQAVADYTGDGRSEVLWRNTATGDVYGWTLGNAGVTAQGGIGTVGTDWQIVA